MKITAVLIVDEIEPSLDFWVGRIGFEKTVEVPEGDKLGFVILQREGAELMLQTRSSVKADVGDIASIYEAKTASLFIEVSDLDDMLARTQGIEPLIPVRTTFYGMRELVLREPGGNVICFAQPVQTAAQS